MKEKEGDTVPFLSFLPWESGGQADESEVGDQTEINSSSEVWLFVLEHCCHIHLQQLQGQHSD